MINHIYPSLHLRSEWEGRQTVVVVFSYGEIDCRCHWLKWRDSADEMTDGYVASIRRWVKDFKKLHNNGRSPDKADTTIVPVVLAVPPPTDQGANPAAPFKGSLNNRVEATQQMNTALNAACERGNVLFTGCDTWDFAATHEGHLRTELSDGHVQNCRFNRGCVGRCTRG